MLICGKWLRTPCQRIPLVLANGPPKIYLTDYNSRNPDDRCPEEILLPSCTKELLNKWLCIYVVETRSHSGEPYPPKTIYSLLCGILREMRVSNPDYPNFLQKDDTSFNAFHVTLDNLFKSLRKEGIGSTSTNTETITKQEEDTLWETKVLNTDTPSGLLRAVFYYCGKCFCLRGGQEHRNLSISQLERLFDPDRYIYRENSSKNRQGGLKQMRMEHKVVTIVANKAVGDRCPVFILDLYISKLPIKVKEEDVFYCRPLSALPQNPEDPWYTAIPIGKNTLCSMVKNIFADAGLPGNKTNHSLRVAGATSLYAAGVPEKVIQGRTGHVSLEALRKYERVTEEQELNVSKVLTGDLESLHNFEIVPPPVTEASEVSPKDPSIPPMPPSNSGGQHYNNCTFNVYSTPGPASPNFQPRPPPPYNWELPPFPYYVPPPMPPPGSNQNTE